MHHFKYSPFLSAVAELLYISNSIEQRSCNAVAGFLSVYFNFLQQYLVIEFYSNYIRLGY